MAKKNTSTKDNELNATLDRINKAYGQGTIMRLGDAPVSDIPSIDSGSIALNQALGVGGYPRGRVVEIYGPESTGKTTLALHAIAQVQKNRGVAAIVDAEHAFDKLYAEKIGVDVDSLLISQPDNGEEGLEVADQLVRSGRVQIVVIDSVAALTPKSELEGEMGDSKLGLQARLMSQALRKLSGNISKTNTCCIFINQLREKIGVMFGCFHYDTLLNFSDGRSIPIGEVVDNKIKGKVWTWNDDGFFEEKKITAWHDNGKVDVKNDFIHIQTQSINGKGRFGFTCTPFHKVLTYRGWRSAISLRHGDKLISKYTEIINGTLFNFLSGMLVGDLTIHIRYKNTGALKLRDNVNANYVEWKISKLNKYIKFNKYKINTGYIYTSEFLYEFAKIKDELQDRDPMFLLSNFSHLGFALWIMDDGHYDEKDSHSRYIISVKRYSDNPKKLDQIVQGINNVGYNCQARYCDGGIVFNKKETHKIAKSIYKYVPECMQYKLPEEYRGYYNDFELYNEPQIKKEFVSVVGKRYASDRQMRNKRKFDISVEDNHNYMVGGSQNGIVVHNSPETTTGGNALKFYASVRLDIRRIGQIKNGEQVVGNSTRVKAVKNKVAPPFRKAEFDIMYGEGISRAAELIDLGVQHGVIKQNGSWYSYGETKLGQGKETVRLLLKDNEELAEEIEKKILDKMS
jgi:recombination protein RecA